MNKWFMRGLRVAYTGLILCLPVAAIANYAATQGSGTNFGSVVIGGVHFMSMLLCDATTANQCAAVSAAGAVKVDNSAVTQPVSSTTLATSALQTTGNTALTTINTTLGTPFQAGGSIGNTTFAVTNTGTFATQSTLQPSATTAIGKVDPNTIATWGLSVGTTPATAPTNTQIVGAIYNTSAPAPTTGQVLPLQLDASGNLNVNIKAGAGSGGTALADQATFTQGTTSETPMGCLYASSYSAGTSGKSTVVSCTSAGSVHTTVDNTNANGQATMANSSPVVIASNQSNLPVIGAGTAGTANSGVVTVQGIASMTPVAVSPTPYPATAVPLTASATGTTGATTATLTNVSGHTTYICGFSIRANATAAATGNATVTGTITATMNYTQWTAPLASGLGVTEEIFAPCVPASAVSTSIAVISAAPGTGGVVSVTAWGYSI